MTATGSLSERLDTILAEIATLCTAADRESYDVTLVAVSKPHPVDRILPTLEAGHRIFGENRVQEAAAKWPELKQRYPDVVLHLIGHLQSNKVVDAVALFDLIETVDRPKLAAALAKEMAKTGRHLPCFVQVNTGEELQKGGVSPDKAVAFVAQCKEEFGLNVRGLMCIPPASDEPAPHFAFLAKMAAQMDLPELSMGMSADYPTAIGLGATYIRLGTAIFGPRGASPVGKNQHEG